MSSFCPGRPCSRGQESLEQFSSHSRGHLAVPPGLSLCAASSAGRDRHLVDLMLLWIRLGCSCALGFLGQEGVRTLFFPFP